MKRGVKTGRGKREGREGRWWENEGRGRGREKEGNECADRGRRRKVGIFSFLLRSNGEGRGGREGKVQTGGRY
jgi:hypothetical protein